MFLNRPKKKYKGQPVSGARIGHPEEAYVELQLGKSFAASGGDGGNALGATEVVNNYEPASDGNKNPRSALSAFGISRKQMELMGIGERELQDRIYRTLTIWSSSMYDSLYTLSNQNPELADKLWTVYSRLVEVCNPRAAVLSAAQRQEFEINMRKASLKLETTRMQAEEDRQRLQERLRESCAFLRLQGSMSLLPSRPSKLKSRGCEVNLKQEQIKSANRVEELAKVQAMSNDMLESLEKTEKELAETSHALHRTNDHLHVAETEVNRMTQLYKTAEEERSEDASDFQRL